MERRCNVCERVTCKCSVENHERVERELLEQCDQIATLAECFAWLQRCDECIERLEELCRAKRAVINSNHIEPRQFLEDAGNIVFERVRDAVERHDSVKVNAAFNGEFVTKDKSCYKSIITKNIEIYRVCIILARTKNCGRTKWTARTTIYYHRISSVATTIASRSSRDNSTIWRIAASLDKLASYLDKDKLKIVRSEFLTLSDKEFELLTRKGVFPYEYINCTEKLQDPRLPPRELFFSLLTGDTVFESDYAHAVNVWQRFSIRTLGKYSDLYLKTDVLILADIFKNFRYSCVASYGLDPAYYYTLPGVRFTWDAMLKHTRVRFELLTDIDMVMFIERGIRGGLSQCSDRYAQANNNMRSYDSSKPSSYLMYYDVNNLYGWAMCQLLPYAAFRWVEDAANFDVSAIAPDSSTGYILEVDLEYPQDLHDRHTDLPFYPMRDKPPGKREDKLLATLTQFRTRAKNDFEKNLYKLINNAVFSKTMENVRNHVDVKLLTKWDRRYGAETNNRETEFPQPQHLCGKFDRRRTAQTRGEVRQADLRGYVYTRYIESLFVRISLRVHVTDVSRQI
ncbi:hypothetical protein ALC57_03033 [Trachymyrmex cornetzi]|uniref:DNA-directed DNA polymerase n=1 Tax=Trachymyrmex cornetzi TaxID=471704 RepID=A0A151JML5_9HYME|nr:hypothetical protein ALC57_03033 [Trachymyrmex cornetzi]